MGKRTPHAARAAESGAQAWRRAVHAQGSATPDHGDFYALAAEMVDTLRALEALARLLGGQMSTYGHGRAVYDDTRTVDPRRRLAEAGRALATLQADLAAAEREANAFFSAIGHIGVELEGGR
jgi:hypothetical protein